MDKPNTHRLKTVQPYFDEVWGGRKKFEIRNNDRNFQPLDYLQLEEYDAANGTYTGRWIGARVVYVLTADDFPDGIKPGYAVLSISVLSNSFDKGDRNV